MPDDEDNPVYAALARSVDSIKKLIECANADLQKARLERILEVEHLFIDEGEVVVIGGSPVSPQDVTIDGKVAGIRLKLSTRDLMERLRYKRDSLISLLKALYTQSHVQHYLTDYNGTIRRNN